MHDSPKYYETGTFIQALLMTVVFWNVENFFGDRPYFNDNLWGPFT